jgi:hypothetical protein
LQFPLISRAGHRPTADRTETPDETCHGGKGVLVFVRALVVRLLGRRRNNCAQCL